MTTPQNRDRILASLHGEVPDAIGVAEMIFWPETAERWREQGLPRDADPGQYFGVDALRRLLAVDLTIGMEPRVLREDEHLIVSRNANGVVTKEKKGSYTPPVQVDVSIRNRGDWDGVLSPMIPGESRIPPDYRGAYDADRAANSVLLYKNPDPCWAAAQRKRMGSSLGRTVSQPQADRPPLTPSRAVWRTGTPSRSVQCGRNTGICLGT